jgi:hypothetical protein
MKSAPILESPPATRKGVRAGIVPWIAFWPGEPGALFANSMNFELRASDNRVSA